MDERIQVSLQNLLNDASFGITTVYERTQRCKSTTTFAKKIEVRCSNDQNLKVVPITNKEQKIYPLHELLLQKVHENYHKCT